MSAVQQKVKNVLNEARILVLVAQVMAGFQLQSVFRASFLELTPAHRRLKLLSISLILFCLALLMAPASRHRLVERGEATEDFHRFVGRCLTPALALFSLIFALDLHAAAARIAPDPAPAILGAATCALALALWYVYPLLHAHRHRD